MSADGYEGFGGDPINLEADLRATKANRALTDLVDLRVPPEDRETELMLRNSIRRNAWRAAACLPLRQDEKAVRLWHTFLNLRQWQAKFRRRHPHRPITPSAA